MPTLAFPSEQFPGFPSVSVPCPDGWSAAVDPEAQVAVVREGSGDEFRANVVVVVTRLDETQQLADVARSCAATLESKREYAEVRRGGTGVAGIAGFVVQGAWVSEEAGTVMQDVRGTIVEHDGVRDLVTVTATCAGGQVDQVWPEMETILGGLQLGEAVRAR